jgi:hypothetical protein
MAGAGSMNTEIQIMKLAAIVSLVLSAVALGLAVFTFVRADAIADRAIERRERELVEQLKPHAFAVFADFDLALGENELQPQTLADLAEPMIRINRSVMAAD